RPLRRAIQREIEDVLSEKILYGELKAGQTIELDAEGEGLLGEFTFRGLDEGEIAPPEPVGVAGATTVDQGHLPAAPARDAPGAVSRLGRVALLDRRPPLRAPGPEPKGRPRDRLPRPRPRWPAAAGRLGERSSP